MVSGVHEDVHTLLAAGVLDKTDDGRLIFPFDRVLVNFELPMTAAAA